MDAGAKPIPLSWMDHGYAPRDLSQSLRLSKTPNGAEITLTRSHLYYGLFSLVCSIPCFALWILYPWGQERYDTEMKWLAVIFGVIFVVLFMVALTLPWRYRRRGQQMVFDLTHGFARARSPVLAKDIAIVDVVGLQMLSRYNESQLNIVGIANGTPFRLWVHTDLHGNIAKLALDFQTCLDWCVVSRIRCVGRRG